MAAHNLQFTADPAGAEVQVHGWDAAADPAQWVHDCSDEALLRFEVTGAT